MVINTLEPYQVLKSDNYSFICETCDLIQQEICENAEAVHEKL